MDKPTLAILGIGNILEKDDGMAVFAAKYLEENYTFEPSVHIINGGVEGINLLNVFMAYDHILILDTIAIDDQPGTIYHIPSSELTGYGLNSGSAHETGVLQCIDMLELMGEALPKSSVVGIVPESITLQIGLSRPLSQAFERYIETVLEIVKENGYRVSRKRELRSLESVIERFTTLEQG